MRKFPKLLFITICLCIIFSMALSACTPSVPAFDSTTKDTATDGTQKPALEPYEVVWYYGGNGTEPNERLIEQAIGEYLKDKINTTVDIVTFPLGEYTQKVQTIISSGEKADLVFSCSWLLHHVPQARAGLFTEITDDMLTRYAPHAKAVLEEKWLPGAKVDGKLYHLSCNKEVGAQGGVLLNKALVEKYNFDVSKIKKYEDLGPMLQVIKENEPNVYPIGTCNNDTAAILVDCLGNWSGENMAIKLPMGSDEWVIACDIPEVVEIWKVAKKFTDAGYVRKDAVTVNDVTPDLKAGKVFATHMQLKPGKAEEVESSTTPGVEWIQVGLTDPVVRSGDVTGSMMAIPKTCENPERVLMFYDYFYHDKNLLTLVNFGIENMHYVKIDENTIDFAPQTEGGTKSGWRPPFSIWMVGDQFKNYLLKSENPNKYAELEKFNQDCKLFGKSLGFLFDPSPIQNTYDKFKASGADQYSLLMIGQAGDVDEAIAKQMKTWNGAGLQEVLKEYNRQYQDFLKNQ
ncbi:MAG: extracellular solute-binding protein [Clostridiaceae bacterium]|jgi:putative aldouronate transport system substrate-binding protein|nr:extracellular solute-binding protein [Clostridiaceae bacterium]